MVAGKMVWIRIAGGGDIEVHFLRERIGQGAQGGFCRGLRRVAGDSTISGRALLLSAEASHMILSDSAAEMRSALI